MSLTKRGVTTAVWGTSGIGTGGALVNAIVISMSEEDIENDGKIEDNNGRTATDIDDTDGKQYQIECVFQTGAGAPTWPAKGASVIITPPGGIATTMLVKKVGKKFARKGEGSVTFTARTFENFAIT